MINKSTYVGLYQHNQTLVLQYNTKIATNTVKSLQHNFFNRVQIFRPTNEEGQKNKKQKKNTHVPLNYFVITNATSTPARYMPFRCFVFATLS